MENQGFRLVEEKKQKKSFFALILSIFTVAGILFCVQQMFVDTNGGLFRCLCPLFVVPLYFPQKV